MQVLGINHVVKSSPVYRGTKTNVQPNKTDKNISSNNKNKSTYMMGAGVVATVAIAGLAVAGHKGKGPLKKIFIQFSKAKSEPINVKPNTKSEVKPQVTNEAKQEITPEIKIESKPEPQPEAKPELKVEKEKVQADNINNPPIETTLKVKDNNEIMAEIKEYLKDKEIVETKQFRPNRTLFVLTKETKEGEPISTTLYRQYGRKYEHDDYDPRTKYTIKKTTYQEDGKTVDRVITYYPNSLDEKEYIQYHKDGKTIKQMDRFASGDGNALIESKSFDENGIEICEI